MPVASKVWSRAEQVPFREGQAGLNAVGPVTVRRICGQ